MEEVERAPGAHGLGDVEAAAMHALAGAGHHAALDQRHARVDQQRVQGKVTVAAQRLQHRLRDGADTDLHGGAIRHEAGDVPADRALDVADDRSRILDQRLVDLHPRVDLARV